MKQENKRPRHPTCDHDHSQPVEPLRVDPVALERAAGLFRALGDSARLRILLYLQRGECCVTELVEALGEKFSTISQRLKILRLEGLIQRRRVGLNVYYTLADGHVAHLLANALDHARELTTGTPTLPEDD